jgi:hypothetical protein
MEHVNQPREANRVHGPIGVPVEILDNFQDTAATEPLQRLGRDRLLPGLLDEAASTTMARSLLCVAIEPPLSPRQSAVEVTAVKRTSGCRVDVLIGQGQVKNDLPSVGEDGVGPLSDDLEVSYDSCAAIANVLVVAAGPLASAPRSVLQLDEPPARSGPQQMAASVRLCPSRNSPRLCRKR